MDQTTNVPVATEDRKTYTTPMLADLGSVAEITQGASGSGADSGVYS